MTPQIALKNHGYTPSPVADALYYFVQESNRIEGIHRVTDAEVDAHRALLDRDELTVTDMERFVLTVAPGKPLRILPSMNVRVGDHVAPQGGPQIVADLAQILSDAKFTLDTYEIHNRYETLHPFIDGNGRSGRALWLWMMTQQGRYDAAVRYGFLHLRYYESLAALSRSTPSPVADALERAGTGTDTGELVERLRAEADRLEPTDSQLLHNPVGEAKFLQAHSAMLRQAAAAISRQAERIAELEEELAHMRKKRTKQENGDG